MSQERVFQVPGGMEYRVTHAEPTPFVEVRAPRDDAPWHIEPIPGYRRLAAFAAEMEARANEYHDTTMKQAKRIAELESALAMATERERITEEAWGYVKARIGGIYDDFQGPEDAMIQMARRLCEIEPRLSPNSAPQ